MADYESRHHDNLPGLFFTDDACIICDLCFELAPSVFKASDDDDHSIVYYQPTTVEERAEAEEAMEMCPVEAIGIHPDAEEKLAPLPGLAPGLPQ